MAAPQEFAIQGLHDIKINSMRVTIVETVANAWQHLALNLRAIEKKDAEWNFSAR
jgi:hypothetical protein